MLLLLPLLLLLLLLPMLLLVLVAVFCAPDHTPTLHPTPPALPRRADNATNNKNRPQAPPLHPLGLLGGRVTTPEEVGGTRCRFWLLFGRRRIIRPTVWPRPIVAY